MDKLSRLITDNGQFKKMGAGKYSHPSDLCLNFFHFSSISVGVILRQFAAGTFIIDTNRRRVWHVLHIPVRYGPVQ